jgi:hypothetical protein
MIWPIDGGYAPCTLRDTSFRVSGKRALTQARHLDGSSALLSMRDSEASAGRHNIPATDDRTRSLSCFVQADVRPIQLVENIVIDVIVERANAGFLGQPLLQQL